MPYLKVQTNLAVNNVDSLISQLSKLVARELGKPEQYVVVVVQPELVMSFAGSRDPAAFLELKSIGLPENKTEPLSSALCAFLTKELTIPGNRIYIEFSSARGSLWGWNGSTF